MNKSELITQLKNKFYEVNEDGIYEGNTEAGITVWSIGVFEKTNDILKKLNLIFYTKGENAFWGISEPNPPIPISEPTFTDHVNNFIALKITDGIIKFGYIDQISDITKKALCIVIISANNAEKEVIISEDNDGNFSIEIIE